MAKDYSERTKALDDIFQRLMVNSGITPANSDNVTVYKGTQREDWAFPKMGGGPADPYGGGNAEQTWGEGVNVTPFQYRAPHEQKILGEMFEKLYGSGAQYETAGAHKNAADAMMAQAGAAMLGAKTTANEFDFLKKSLEEKRKKAAAAEFDKVPAYEASPDKPPVATPGGRPVGVNPNAGVINQGVLNMSDPNWFQKRYGALRITK